MKIAEILSRNTVHIPMFCTLQEAAVRMRDQHVGALIVTDGGEPAQVTGFVTDRDIVLNRVALQHVLATPRVADVMSHHVVAIDAEADLEDALATMSKHGVRRVAATDSARGMVGVLALDDLIEALGRDLGMLSDIIRAGRARESDEVAVLPLASDIDGEEGCGSAQ